MALYDHRVFRCGEDWWVGQVHSGSADASGILPARLDSETVLFSCLSQGDLPSRSGRIRANALNALTHGSVCLILEGARRWETDRFPMSPFNAPTADAGIEFIDDEELQWGVSIGSAINSSSDVVPSLEFVCLEDSALAFTVSVGSREEADRLIGHPGHFVRFVQAHRRTLIDLRRDELAVWALGTPS